MSPTPPVNVARDVACPGCGTVRNTAAQPNTNLRCAGCGLMFKAPRPGEPAAAPAAEEETPAAREGPGEVANSGEPADGSGVKVRRARPELHPAPPPPPGTEPVQTEPEPEVAPPSSEAPPPPPGPGPAEEPASPPPAEVPPPPAPAPQARASRRRGGWKHGKD